MKSWPTVRLRNISLRQFISSSANSKSLHIAPFSHANIPNQALLRTLTLAVFRTVAVPGAHQSAALRPRPSQNSNQMPRKKQLQTHLLLRRLLTATHGLQSGTRRTSSYLSFFSRTWCLTCLFALSSATVRPSHRRRHAAEMLWAVAAAIRNRAACLNYTCHVTLPSAVVAEATVFAADVVSSSTAAAAWEVAMGCRRNVWDSETLANNAKDRFLSAATNINALVCEVMVAKHGHSRSDAFVTALDTWVTVSKRPRLMLAQSPIFATRVQNI
jgi:hypothetical protein